MQRIALVLHVRRLMDIAFKARRIRQAPRGMRNADGGEFRVKSNCLVSLQQQAHLAHHHENQPRTPYPALLRGAVAAAGTVVARSPCLDVVSHHREWLPLRRSTGGEIRYQDQPADQPTIKEMEVHLHLFVSTHRPDQTQGPSTRLDLSISSKWATLVSHLTLRSSSSTLS